MDGSTLFSDSNSVELAIVAVCTFAATVAVVVLLFLFIGCFIFKKGKQTEKSNNLHEMKSY